MLNNFLNKFIFQRTGGQFLSYAKWRASERFIRTVDNITLQGWKIENESASADTSVLYFGGNAEDVTQSINLIKSLGFKTIYLYNYRGYGLSEGVPSQENLYSDALKIYDSIVESSANVLNRNLFIIGRSLGAAVAVYLAAQRPVSKVILVTPFKSIHSLVREKFPPLHLFIKQKFPSDEYAPEITASLLMLIGESDTLISNENSKSLFNIWKGKKQLKSIEHAGHNDIHQSIEFETAIKEFVNGDKSSPKIESENISF
jgi:pimeloyl-ACP methyl ester carboxylesterase